VQSIAWWLLKNGHGTGHCTTWVRLSCIVCVIYISATCTLPHALLKAMIVLWMRPLIWPFIANGETLRCGCVREWELRYSSNPHSSFISEILGCVYIVPNLRMVLTSADTVITSKASKRFLHIIYMWCNHPYRISISKVNVLPTELLK